MNFKGGVLIAGSLFWDKSEKRAEWRKICLSPLEESKTVKLPIVYGRLSITRSNTYTIIYTKHYGKFPSYGKLVKLKNQQLSSHEIYDQAVELAIAECICNKEKPEIYCNWGTIGLLLNPNILTQNSSLYKELCDHWTSFFSKRKEPVQHDFNIFPTDEPVIFNNGFLNLEWEKEYEELDFLLAALTVPQPKNHELLPLEIAHKMVDNNNFEYFKKNRESGIVTFQDEEIIDHLKKLSCCYTSKFDF